MSAMFGVISEPNEKYDWITIRILAFSLSMMHFIQSKHKDTI